MLDDVIRQLRSISEAIDTISERVTPYAIDLKRGELRVGVGSNGIMPPYRSQEYYNFKKGLSTYKANGNYDLFVSGRLAKGLEATEEKGIIYVGNSNNSPDYASDFEEYTEGISDKGAEQIAERAFIILVNDIKQIRSV